MKEILSDIDKLKKLNVKPGKELNFLLQHQDKLVIFLKLIKKSLGDEVYKKFVATGFTIMSFIWFVQNSRTTC